ncbi:MAG: glycosyltransferase family 1 protein [Chloroflexi bacterium]|nr:MAG: glycosyltransferase family 1 protein [Chloroflexota bacterium]MBL1195881.1 glycosyltransferase family 1 protein [Chloroflexota bacterium]NOH13173.1 glycosyltransferase family 4 protein [Chloroflexota bacterium]
MAVPFYVNARALGKSDSGIARYTAEMIKQLGDDAQVLQPQQPRNGIGGHIWEQVTLPQQLPKDAVLWSPANTGPLRVANQVLTLHDVSVLEHPEWFSPLFATWYRFLLPRLVSHVRKIITVSEFSKRRIAEILGVPAEKIVVIPNGVDHQVFYPRKHSEIDLAKAEYGLGGDYVISVGSLQPRKNLDRLFEAWQQVAVKFPSIELVVVGVEDQVFCNRGFKELPSNVRFLANVPDADLAALYSGARVCIQPSLYEGFNLPVLEAIACGAPVLAAKTTATPEMIGDAGISFDPLSAKEIGEALQTLLSQRELAKGLSIKGLEQAKNYSWEKATEATLEILKASR